MSNPNDTRPSSPAPADGVATQPPTEAQIAAFRKDQHEFYKSEARRLAPQDDYYRTKRNIAVNQLEELKAQIELGYLRGQLKQGATPQGGDTTELPTDNSEPVATPSN